MEKELANETSFLFVGIPKKKQQTILNILKKCKEIRDTAYPLKDSIKRNLTIKSFTAVKEKDMVSITGALLLQEEEKMENRVFEAYVMENKEEIRVFLDITRLCVEDEPKLIRTSETIIEKEEKTIIITKYNRMETAEEKIFTEEIPK